MIYIDTSPAPLDDMSLPIVLFDNFYNKGTISWTSAMSGFPGSNVATESTFDYWAPNNAPDSVSVNLGTPMEADTFAVIAHTLGSSGSVVNFEQSTDGATWVFVGQVTPTDDTPILFLFRGVTKQYWRVRILSTTTDPVIGNIVLGKRFTFPGGVMPPYTPIWQAQMVDLLNAKSLGGQFLGNRVLRKGADTSISLVSFSNTFAETDLQPFFEWYNGGHAFVWASSPENFVHDVGYVWRKSGAEMRPTFTETGNWVKVTMEVEGYVQ